MKKLLLSLCGMGISLFAFSQANIPGAPLQNSKHKLNDHETMNAAIGPVKQNHSRISYGYGSPNAKSAAITVVPLGNAANTFTAIGARTQLQAIPQINSVVFIHRSTTPTQTPAGLGSGYLMYDISTDGGNTFSVNQGPFYDPTLTTPVAFADARYPQMVVYTPTSSTSANDAYMSWHAPTLTGGNGASWGGLAFGTVKLDGSSMNQDQQVQPGTGGVYYQVPDDMVLDANGNTWTIEPSIDLNLALDYVDTLMVRKGTWQSSTNTHTYVDMPIELVASADATGNKQLANSSIAFGMNGNIGYVTALSHIDYTTEPDSVLTIVTRKTTDGGATWGAPIQVDISTIADPFLLSDPNGSYTAGFELKTQVDANGNLHVVCAIGPDADGFSIGTTPGTWGIFDIYTTDGGTTWTGFLLAQPQQFRGFWDTAGSDLSEDSRPQITTTTDRTKMFFSWLDTDSLIFGTFDGNAFPDLWVRGFNVNTSMSTAATNFTTGTAADGQVSYGVASKYAFVPQAGTYRVPYCYMINDPISPSTDMKPFNYLNEVDFTDADFNIPVGINSLEGEYGNVSVLYPNPLSGVGTYDLDLTVKQDVLVTVTNIYGQVISRNDLGTLIPGSHRFTLDVNNWSKGIYLLNINIGGQDLTQRFVVN